MPRMALGDDGLNRAPPAWRRSAVPCFVALATLSTSAPAAAQSACPRQAQVDAMEEQARQLRDRDDAGALTLLQQAYGMCHGARALGRMGLAEIALGRWLDADEHLRAAMAQRSDPWVSQTYANLEGQLRIVGEHLGSLELPGEGGPAEVFIGSRRVGAWPTRQPLRVVAGSVTFTVRREGYAPVTRTVTVVPGGTARERVELARLDAAGSTGGGSTQRTVAWVLAGSALAALGVGVGLTVARFGEHEENFRPYSANPRCSPVEQDPAECGRLYQQAVDADANWTPLQAAAYGLGGALAVAAVVVFATAPSGRVERPRAARCGPGPGTLGAGCQWSF